jgi:hypothetical protein
MLAIDKRPSGDVWTRLRNRVPLPSPCGPPLLDDALDDDELDAEELAELLDEEPLEDEVSTLPSIGSGTILGSALQEANRSTTARTMRFMLLPWLTCSLMAPAHPPPPIRYQSTMKMRDC